MLLAPGLAGVEAVGVDEAHERAEVLLPTQAGVGGHVGDRRPLGHLGQHLFDEVPGPTKLTSITSTSGERRPGEPGAVEEGVDGCPTPGGARHDGRLVAEVDLEELGDVDGHRLDVDGDHLGTELGEDWPSPRPSRTPPR